MIETIPRKNTTHHKAFVTIMEFELQVNLALSIFFLQISYSFSKPRIRMTQVCKTDKFLQFLFKVETPTILIEYSQIETKAEKIFTPNQSF